MSASATTAPKPDASDIAALPSSSSSSSSAAEWWRSHLSAASKTNNAVVVGFSSSAAAADPLDEIFFTEEHPSGGPALTSITISGDDAGVSSLLAAFSAYASRFSSVRTLYILPQVSGDESSALQIDDKLIDAIAAGMPALTELFIAATTTFSNTRATSSLTTLSQLESFSIRFARSCSSSIIPPFLQAIAKLQRLQKFSVQGAVSGACDLSLLSSLTQLRSLDLGLYAWCEDDAKAALTSDAARAIFTANTQLTDLRLGPVTCESTEAVVQLLPQVARNVTSLDVSDESNNGTQPGSPLLSVLERVSSQLQSLQIDFLYPPTDSLREAPLLPLVRSLSDGLQVLILKSHMCVSDKVLEELAKSGASRSLKMLGLNSYGFSSNGVRALRGLSQMAVLHLPLDWCWHAHMSNGQPAAEPKPTTDEQLYNCFKELTSLVELIVTAGRSAGVAEFTLTADVLPRTLLSIGTQGLSGARASQADGTPAQEEPKTHFNRLSKHLVSLLSSLPLESVHGMTISELCYASRRAGLNDWHQEFENLITELTKPHQLRTSTLPLLNHLNDSSHARFIDPPQARAQLVQFLQRQG